MVSTTFPPPTTLPTTLSRLLMKETFQSHVVERNQVFHVLFVWILTFPFKAVDLEIMYSRLQQLAANMARQLPKHRLRSSIRIPADCAACWCRRDMICAHQNPISQDRRSEPSCASEFGRAANIGGWDGEWEVVVGMKVVCHTLTGGGEVCGSQVAGRENTTPYPVHRTFKVASINCVWRLLVKKMFIRYRWLLDWHRSTFFCVSSQKKHTFFWALPKLGGPPAKINFDPFWFWHLFESEKVAQIVCRGKGVIWAMLKWKEVLGKFSLSIVTITSQTMHICIMKLTFKRLPLPPFGPPE